MSVSLKLIKEEPPGKRSFNLGRREREARVRVTFEVHFAVQRAPLMRALSCTQLRRAIWVK